MTLVNNQQGHVKSQQGQSSQPDVVECYPTRFRSTSHPSMETEAELYGSFQLRQFLVTSDCSLWKLLKSCGPPSTGPTELSLGCFCSPSAAVFRNTLFPPPDQLQSIVSSWSTCFGLLPSTQLGFHNWQQKRSSTKPSSCHYLSTRLSCLGLYKLAQLQCEEPGLETQVSVFS